MNLLHKKRALFMNHKTVEAGYTPVEYIESNGTQYIDTGIKLSNDMSGLNIDCTFLPNKIFGKNESDYTYVFGVVEQFFQGAYCFLWPDTSESPNIKSLIAADIGWGWNVPTHYSFYAQAGEKYNIKLNRSRFIINDDYVCTLGHGYRVNDATIFIFSTSNKSGENISNYAFSGKIFSFKMSLNGQLIRDFQPSIDFNGKACFFDLVEQKPYYSPVGDDFIAGGVI